MGPLKGAYTKLYGVFIDGLIPRPEALSREIVYDVDSMDSTTPYQWNFAMEYLKFPEQVYMHCSRLDVCMCFFFVTNYVCFFY